MLARKFTLAKTVVGAPKISDFKIVEETLRADLKDGEILAKAEWLTVDPYMRIHCMDNMSIGEELEGAQVARVIKSRSKEFPEGTQVLGYFGWRDLTIYKPDLTIPRSWKNIVKLPDMKGLPDSYALGCLGMPGNTAYFGLKTICDPKPGETLVVSAAAGAVGSLVGQIGKLYGCKVIGFAGRDDKLKWLTEELGFDHAFNYKTVNIDTTLKQYAPNGVDCYFDNVGGEFAFDVARNMNRRGRISQCGSISDYNDMRNSKPLVYFDYAQFRIKSLRMEGYTSERWELEGVWDDGIHQLREWILEGKLKIQESVTHGFENMAQAFIELLEGKNIGKQIIKV